MSSLQSLVCAIEKKYTDDDEEEDHNSGSWVIYVPKPKPKPGESGTLNVPQRLTMEDYNINTAGDVTKLKEVCGSVQELDLTKNALTDWNQVLCILENLPDMWFLNLTRNSLADSTCPEGTRTFPCLKNLVLNGTGVSWGTVAKLLSWFPSLEELHLSLMDYTSVDLPSNFTHNALKTLYLNECNISEWAEISKLGRAFPSLEYLNLIKINIKTLSDDDQYDEFSSLTSLNISETELELWTEIDKFRHFPSLTHVKLAGLSFLKDWEPKERRQHIIARLPNITMLNGSPISELERENADRAFIRYYMELEEDCPRYKELEAIHGKLDPLVDIDMAPKEAHSLLVKYEDKEEFMDIPSHQTVAELKKILKNFCGLPPAKYRLYVNRIVQGQLIFTEEVKPLTKKIYQLNMKDEDMFNIVPK